MDKTGYERIKQVLSNVITDLEDCQDDDKGIREFENNARQAIWYAERARNNVAEIVTAFDAVPDGEPEFVFHFHPEKGKYAFVAMAGENRHANTVSRLFTRYTYGYGCTSIWPRTSYDRTKWPPSNPPVLEYNSGHDGKFYRMFPDFEKQTVLTLQEEPTNWR